MTDPTPDPTPVTTLNRAQRVTYAELARARGVSVPAARKLALRHRWPKQVGNDGLSHVLVPASFMEDAGGRDVPTDGAGVGGGVGVAPDLRTIDLGTIIAPLQETIAVLRAERDAERERADRAERVVGVVRAKLVAARYVAEVLGSEVTALRKKRGWWPWGR